MQESGVDLEFDIFHSFVDDVEQSKFYEIQSRTLDDVISKPTSSSLATTADEILTEVLNKERMASMSRTQQKLQLQREHLLKQEQKKKEQERKRQLEQSSEVSIPFPRPTETLPPHIPPTVLKFKTKLENPTKYYVFKTQERKLKEYINQQSTDQSQGFSTSSPQPTLNAINNLAAAMAIGPENYGMKPPDSPMSAASSTGTSEVDDILDDIISLEGDAGVGQVGLDHSFDPFFGLAHATTLSAAPASLSELYDVRNMQSIGATVLDTISSSCPPIIKQEPLEDKFDHVSFLKDRQKKDNHNMTNATSGRFTQCDWLLSGRVVALASSACHIIKLDNVERRRRFNINDRIKELGTIIPKQDSEMKQNKGTILKSTVDYIWHLRKEVERGKLHHERYRETEKLNSKLLLRIKELEMHCRAHNVPVTPLTNDTSTATLSSLLVTKEMHGPHIGIKQERCYDDDSASCSMDELSESSAHYPDDDGRNSMES